MTAEQALSYIHSTCWKGSVPGLSRTEELLSRMGDPHKSLKYIHIVGTNGKGSTAAMLDSILRAAGYTTGLYTSPYIFRFNERMQVNGQPIEDKELAEITEFVRPHAEDMEDKPTEFELITCIAFEFFRRKNTDIVVLEAGMGGLLDSTNVIPSPEAAVICNIGLDHTEYLGSTLEAIAQTKAGIIKPGCRCVLYPSTSGVTRAVAEKCKKENVPLHEADFSLLQAHTADLTGQTFSWGSYENLKISLLGKHQLHNACTVLTTVAALREQGWKIPDDAIRQGLSSAKWPGRFQLIRQDPLFVVDGGHNPQCMEALVQGIRQYLGGMDLTVVTGVMADKDKGAMYPPLLPYASRFVTVTPDNPRAMGAPDLAAYLEELGAEATPYATVQEGVEAAIRLARAHSGAVLACGSLYMVGELTQAALKTP